MSKHRVFDRATVQQPDRMDAPLLAEAVTRLNQNQVAFQASLQVTARLNQISMLDFLPII